MEASLDEGMLKGSFVSEPGIRLQLFEPMSPRAGELSVKVKGQGILKNSSLQIQGVGYIDAITPDLVGNLST
jgi:hypothetical protein